MALLAIFADVDCFCTGRGAFAAGLGGGGGGGVGCSFFVQPEKSRAATSRDARTNDLLFAFFLILGLFLVKKTERCRQTIYFHHHSSAHILYVGNIDVADIYYAWQAADSYKKISYIEIGAVDGNIDGDR